MTAPNPVPTDAELAASLDGDFTSAHAEVNGTRLHHVTGGAGEPLVLLGGWPQTWWQFRKVMPALARRFRVTAVDLRGMGSSAKPETGYDKRTMGEDIHELIRHLGHESAFVAGHDIGASVGYHLAANHPESVRRLVTIDLGVPVDSWLRIPMLPASDEQQVALETGRGGYPWWFAFNQLRELPERLLVGRFRHVIDWLYGHMLVDQASVEEEARRVYAHAYDNPDAIRAGSGWYQTMRQDVAALATYAPVTVPILTLAGESSYAALREQMSPDLGTDIRVVEMKGSGHYVPEEAPDVVVRELTEFFEAHEG
ncbi:Pimeloyl-ACP methyl ester carboxylesterase [Streptoalloteichus tenebrarius]|uniref:Pimeloyl-ACP methyl ester carboxylesterase n=1 Tax=Streptoalloteichus tenebrarius (strain ATCC 17920 / DSM 40477 / JCM 4838 / CBS 697.72 / NBRC 16177 / NCIMB 11028 / NRRL B-12390 / A12253. 1 / ISP 5477) TaxID=1933 RepID=A0ABT1HLR4_STRSD|nr:alpha/beta hydrolase [Streptoalloteichus tenebrarius]MCP2256467.1 Pimeloyl-ACP methyl ester carboxylesterase [Streptoalloteichus tenebrarius]BFF04818.1 alpha/beta hydrolase [Streptoalloteichus tenebrarius]